LLDTVKMKSHSEKQFQYAMAGIIAHEMSHLANGDYVPGLILSINRKVTSISRIFVKIIFVIITRILNLIPRIGYIVSRMFIWPEKILIKILTFFNDIVLIKIYKFLTIYTTRAIEYRSDADAAKAFGGKSIAMALHMIGSGYDSIFSTHPSSTKRIAAAMKIEHPQNHRIHPSFILQLSNLIGIFSFFGITYFLFKTINFSYYVEIYQNILLLPHVFYSKFYNIAHHYMHYLPI
jgi:hypothetical protein